ncbi:MAG: hypothetical protein WA705_19060 [Candidatus Ozemobacteraceae bacterium]
MSRRYSPHALQRKAREWPAFSHPIVGVNPQNALHPCNFAGIHPPVEIFQEVVLRARSIWLGDGPWFDVLSCDVPAGEPAELLAEYGVDAVRIASLTASGGAFPDISLLESALRWLAQWYDRLYPSPASSTTTAITACATGVDSSPVATGDVSRVNADGIWDATSWLGAAAAAQDHLFLRNRAYPALAAIKRAWKTAPINADSSSNAHSLAILLLMPFAPVLGVTLWNALHLSASFTPLLPPSSREKENTRPPLPLLQTAVDTFRPLRAVFIAMEKSGRRYEIVDEIRLATDPRGVIAELPWLKHTLGDALWDVRREGDCLRIYFRNKRC